MHIENFMYLLGVQTNFRHLKKIALGENCITRMGKSLMKNVIRQDHIRLQAKFGLVGKQHTCPPRRCPQYTFSALG